MNENKTTEVIRLMVEIMTLQKEIAAKNRETVDCINNVLRTLAAND